MKLLSATLKKQASKAGKKPGFLAESKEKALVSTICYSRTGVEEKEGIVKSRGVQWTNVIGVGDTTLLTKLAKDYNLHALLVEDIANTSQRPKFEGFTDKIFFVVKMLQYDKEGLQTEQVSFVLEKNILFSFQEREGDVFDGVRERIRVPKARIRERGADYLLFALADAIVDNYYVVLEKISEKVEQLEKELLENATESTLKKMYAVKRELIFVKRAIWPLREATNSLLRTESKLIKNTTDPFLRDLYDHTIQVIDTTETLRDMVAGMLDTYLSSISNRMNEVMKVLTIFASIFIPLTFFAGIYGMNFNFMPELNWRWSYPLLWGFMLSVGGGMLIFFRRRKWL